MFKKGKKSFAVVISAVLIAALCMFAGCVESADSTSSEPSDCAAKIGKVYYYTVAEAIEAAKLGDTVTLVNDVFLDEGLVINKKVTLSLNGKNISAEGDVEKLISVNEGADLTIIGEGEVTAPDGTRTILFVNGGKVTVEGGKYDGGNGGSYDICVYVVSGEAVLNGGEFTTGVDKDNYANSVIYNNGTGKITINGGYYWTDYAYNGFYYVLNQQNSAAGEIKVYGGTFKNYNPANGDDNLRGNFVAWGYVSMANGDGTTYTVMARPETYEVSTAAELESAIENAIDGNTVKLTADVVIDHTLVIDDDITLDLNGKTISNTSDIWSDDDWSLVSVTRCAKVTIDGNGKLLAKENDCYAVDVQDGSELTIESGYFNGNVHAVYVLEGKLTVNGGKFEVQQPYPGAGKEYEFVLNCYDANHKEGTAKIIVYGGEFVKFNPADCKAEGEGTNFVAEGYVSMAKGDGTIYTVMARPETYEAGTEAELESAIENAIDGNTVKLTADVVIDHTLVIDDDITLDLNGKTISNTSDIWSDADGDWSLVSVMRCAKVTIDGNGKLLAKENDCFAVDVQDGSELTIESGYFNGNVHAVYVYEGKLTVNGGKFEVQQPYSVAGKEYEFVLNCYDANRNAGTAKIIVYGGEFVKFNPADCKAEGEGTNFVAEGYVSMAKGDGTIYTVTARPETYEAGTEAELESAIKNAVSGNTIKLTADIDSAVDSQKFIVYNIAGITLDLNGKTYSHKNGAHAFEGTGGVIKNGKIVCKGGSYALFVGDEGETTSFTVENIELIGGVNVYNATNVVLKDLNVTAADYYAVWADSAATVTVQGGTYDLGKGKTVFAATKTESGDFISVITVEGNCTAKGNTLFLDNGGKLIIKGGTYEVNPTDYLATGYEVTTSTVEGKTTYTVAAAQNN